MSELEEFSEKCRLISVHISGPEITRLNKAIQKVDDLAERYGGKKDLELSRINTDTGIKGLWRVSNIYIFGETEYPRS